MKMIGDEIHAFEIAGLGKGPFKFNGVSQKIFKATHDSPGKPGGSCAFCGTGITDCCHVESSDGKQFIVGSTCINKVGDVGLRSATKKAMNKIKTEQRQIREAKKIAVGQEIINGSEFQSYFAALPHPWENRAAQGETRLDGIRQYWNMCGNSGKCKYIKTLKELSDLAAN